MKATSGFRIALRRGMVEKNHPQVKVFTSEDAFKGYVSGLRANGVIVTFTGQFNAACKEVA